MPSTLEIAGDLTAAATALAGLLLVFIGFAVTSFEGYEADQQGAVRVRYQRRVWLSFAGFAFAIAAALLAVIGKWLTIECLPFTALIFFALALIIAVAAALLASLEVR